MQTSTPTNRSAEDRFYYNICELADLLLELAQDCKDQGINDINPGMLGLAKSMLTNFEKTYLIESFINNTHEYWEQVRNQNANFFIEHAADIFKSLPVSNINVFQILFTARNSQGSLIISEEDRQLVWSYFSSLIRISIKYIHEKRGLKFTQYSDGLKPEYKYNFMSHIKVRQHAKLWEVKLAGFDE